MCGPSDPRWRLLALPRLIMSEEDVTTRLQLLERGFELRHQINLQDQQS